MDVDWDYGAQAIFDQLGPHQQALVTAAVDQAAADWDGAGAERVVLSGRQPSVEYVLRAGTDLRVFVSRTADRLTVMDVVPRKQFLRAWSEGAAHRGEHAQA